MISRVIHAVPVLFLIFLVCLSSPADDIWSRQDVEQENETKRADPWSVSGEETEVEEEPDKAELLSEIAGRWQTSGRKPPKLDRKETRGGTLGSEPGIDLPLNSNLQITGYKSISFEYNHTHYFGRSDISRYQSSSSFTSGFSGLDLGSDYGYGYDYGGFGSYDYGMSGYDSYSSYGSYGGYGGFRGPRTGWNLDQAMEVGLHGRIGDHTHVSVDYSDTGSSYYSGISNKQQKIAVWYEGGASNIIKRAAFGDLTLDLPNVRFLNLTRNLFGVELIAELAGVRLTAFGSRSKGLKGKWSSRGESQRAGGGMGMRILDTNYIKGKYYALNVGEDGLIHESYLPIKAGSEEIYIDDGDGSNNIGGIKTAQGYFDLQYPGEDYNLNYETGEIEFLKMISSRYKIVVAYEYLGGNGGKIGNPGNVFADDDNDGVIDEADDPNDPPGYVTIKDIDRPGLELRNVYSLGNRNISPRDYQISIWREGGTDVFQTDEGPALYIQIFGIDQDGDGLVDPEFIDFEKGLLRFPTPRPFMIDDPQSPYYKYRDQLNNEALYADNPSMMDQLYTIQAQYSYRFDTYSLNRLNIIPGSETVTVNGMKLQRDIDYMMIYETGTITFFKKLDEYNEIEVEYEYSPFGGAMQQSVLGVWADYSYQPKSAPDVSQPSQIPGGDFSGSFSNSFSNFGGFDSYGGSSFGGSFGSSFGSSFGNSFGSSYGYSSRRSYGSFGSTFRPTFKKGINISAGYIYNSGGGTALVPDVNESPSRIQAFDINTSMGHTLNLARLFNLIPFLSTERFDLSVDFSGEAAYSRNNPNSFGFALIDGMEGIRESTRVSTLKFDWKQASLPLSGNVDPFGREILQMVKRDEDDVQGNYYKNTRLPASAINPISRSTEEETVMEIGYDMGATRTWLGLSKSLSEDSLDLSDRDFLNFWVKTEGDDEIILHIDIGIVSEDSDGDSILDSEDLPDNLVDTNGDGKIDGLDLSLEDLPESQKYKGNGILESDEDIGWIYNQEGFEVRIGSGNSVLDTEDLNKDMVLQTSESYFEISIPMDSIPSEWLKKENRNSGWRYLSIPLVAAETYGRPPSWGYIKHIRLWIEKTGLTAQGKLFWGDMEIAGNRWERGVVVDENGTTRTETDEMFLVGAKDNFDYEDYYLAYQDLEEEKDFRKLHPLVQTGFGFTESQPREQSLVLTYRLNSGSQGVTSKALRGQMPGDGQDFSKYDTLAFWVYGDGQGGDLLLRLGTSLKTGSYYYYSSSSYGSYDQPKPTEPVNIFAQGTQDYYELEVPINFMGWRKIEVDLRDADADGHPDGLKVNGNPSISNIGGILVGLSNRTGKTIEGEVWVNDIHLTDPMIRSGWARRGDLSVNLGNRLRITAGYANQDKDFESSAGQTDTYGSSYYSYSSGTGYSTSTYDYNLNSELLLFSWLPLRYSVRYTESESEARRGTISSYTYGKNRGTSRNISLQFNRGKLPNIYLSLDRQKIWNEKRGTDISDLYSSGLSYDFRGKLGVNLEYRHEDTDVKPETAEAQEDTTGSSYYGYYSQGKEKVDSGSISLRINPIQGFGLNPVYDISREMEYREETTGTGETASKSAGYEIASRNQRFSLRPTLRDFWGIRPSLGSRLGYRETWFGGNKDASLDIESDFRLDIRPQKWFSFEKKTKPEESKPQPTTASSDISSSLPSADRIEELKEQERRRLEYQGVTSEQLEQLEEQKGDWIGRERLEIERKLRERERMGNIRQKGLWEQLITTATIGGGINFSTSDYLRKLQPGTSVLDVLAMSEDAPERSRTTRRTRISFRSSVDPLSWASLGFDYSQYRIFSKTAGTSSRDDSSSYNADIKMFNSKNTSTLQLKYTYSRNSRSTGATNIYSSSGHSPSLAWQQKWGKGTNTAFGVMLTLKNSQRSGGIEGDALIIKPNFNVSYRVHVEGKWRMPILGRSISLNHDFNLRNTFATVVTRRTLGINREDKSERYETSLNADYNLSSRIRMNFHLSLSYNNDRVEAGRDYISIMTGLMARGEFR